MVEFIVRLYCPTRLASSRPITSLAVYLTSSQLLDCPATNYDEHAACSI